MFNFQVLKFVVCYQLIKYLGFSGGGFEVCWQAVCVWYLLFSGLRWVFCVTNFTSLWWWPNCALVCWCHWYLCDWGVWEMVFCLRLTGHWFGGLSWTVYDVYTKCFCWEYTAQALEKWLWCFITALIHLFILVISFLFIPEQYG